MTTGHLVVSIIIVGTMIGAWIYFESVVRNGRATKVAERRRRAERERQKRATGK